MISISKIRRSVVIIEYVEPIKSKEHIEAMKSSLKSKSLRDWLLFTLGINSGLRISDLLKLTVEDVVNRDRISVKEQKSARKARPAKDGLPSKPAKAGKTKDFPLSKTCILAINEYLRETGLTTGVLFPSRKSGESGAAKAISRQQAYQVINDAAVDAKVITASNGVKIGCHSLRKSFGFHAYNKGVSLELIQKLLNHSSPAVTLRYIGITKESMDEVYLGMDL